MNQPPPPPGAPLQHAGFGITSFVLGILNLLGAAISFVLMFVIIGFFIYYIVMTTAFIGLVCGIIGLVQPDRRRGFAIAGVVCNAIALIPATFYIFATV